MANSMAADAEALDALAADLSGWRRKMRAVLKRDHLAGDEIRVVYLLNLRAAYAALRDARESAKVAAKLLRAKGGG